MICLLFFLFTVFPLALFGQKAYVCATTSVNVRNAPCGSKVSVADVGDMRELKAGTTATTACSHTWLPFADGTFSASSYWQKCFPSGAEMCADTYVNVRRSPCGTKTSAAAPGQKFVAGANVRFDTSCGDFMWNELSDGNWVASKFFSPCASTPGPGPTGSTRDFTVPDPQNYCFPIKDGFYRNTKNWGQSRVKYDVRGRCHPGVDLLTQGTSNKGMVRAIVEGEVIVSTKQWYRCRSGRTYNTAPGTYEYVGAIYVYNSIIDRTFVYGEINSYDVKVRVGDRVSKGQELGVASKCSMLHLEIYKGKGRNHGSGVYQGRTSYGWLLYDSYGMSPLPKGNNVCRDRPSVMAILDDIDSKLLNPLPFIEQIKDNPDSCAHRPTYSITNQMEMMEADIRDDDNPPPEDEMDLFVAVEETGMSGGSVAGVVLGSIFGIAAIVLVVVAVVCIACCCVRRKRAGAKRLNGPDGDKPTQLTERFIE